jgi:hypothetical protein
MSKAYGKLRREVKRFPKAISKSPCRRAWLRAARQARRCRAAVDGQGVVIGCAGSSGCIQDGPSARQRCCSPVLTRVLEIGIDACKKGAIIVV